MSDSDLDTAVALCRLLLPAITRGQPPAQTETILAQLRQALPDDAWQPIDRALASDRLLSRLTTLFDQLRRQAEWSLGISEFLLLLEALQTELGQKAQQDTAVLLQLCQLVWAKSPLEQAVLAHFFRQIIPLPAAAPETRPDEAAEQPEAEEEERPLPERDDVEPTPPPETQIPDVDKTPTSREVKQEDLLRETAEQALDSTPTRTIDTEDREIAYHRFLLTADYLPITRRQLKQSWRYLRRPVREGPPAEIDVPATVRRITEDGYFLTPVMRPRRTNKAALLLLIDQNGSMVPFHGLSHRLEETITEAGHLGQVGVYYFHDCPAVRRDGRIYTDLYREHTVYAQPQGLDAQTISDILKEYDSGRTGVLIFSDAGAARGDWDGERIEATAVFLHQLRHLGIKNIAWLNPLPPDRWDYEQLKAKSLLETFENSATAIAEFVPMFSMERDGLYRAIDVLRGRTPYRVMIENG